MVIILTEKPSEDGSSETVWEVAMTANLPKDSTPEEQDKWDQGAIGLVLMNHGFGMISQHYRKTKALLQLAEAEKAEREAAPKIVLPSQADMNQLKRPGNPG